MKRSKSVLEAYLNVWVDLMRNWLRNLGFYHKTLTRNENKAWLCLDLESLMDFACSCDVGREFEVESKRDIFFHLYELCVYLKGNIKIDV